MGTDAQDYDNDGLPDLIVTALTGETSSCYGIRAKAVSRTSPFRAAWD